MNSIQIGIKLRWRMKKLVGIKKTIVDLHKFKTLDWQYKIKMTPG